MDPLSLIITALSAGTAQGAENVASTAVRDAYRGLKRLLSDRFSGKKEAEIALAEHDADPDVWRAPLEKALRDTGAIADPDVIAAAQRLMALLDNPGSRSGRYQVYQRDVQGSQIGNQNIQINEFSSPATDPPRASSIDSPGIPNRPMLDEPVVGRPSSGQREPDSGSSGRWESGAADHVFIWTPLGMAGGEDLVVGRPSSEQHEPDSRSSDRSESGAPDHVILIERCSGIQVGQDNDQYSAYRVTLPSAALRSAQALADHLLSHDLPWSRDVFSHDATPEFGAAPGWFGSRSSGVATGPDGDTLVIVRNSRGVQVGDHNLQRNDFRIRVADVSVQAERLGMTAERKAAIERLRQDPGDRAAARWLATDVTRAASAHLVVDLTARVDRDVGHPQINEWSGKLRGQTGRQVGGPNRARVTVDVKVSRLPSDNLTRELLRRAQIRARHTPRPETPAPRSISNPDWTRRPRPPDIPGPHLGRGGRGFR